MSATLHKGAIALLAVLTLVYIGPKVFSPTDTVDFKYIWLAGEMWVAGENPYSDLYVTKGEELFVGHNRPVFWPYPPNWWPVAALFSVPEYTAAGPFWRIATALALIVGCLTVSRAVTACVVPLPLWRHAVFWSCVGTMSATAITLSLGQTSGLIFLGVCLFAAAWFHKSVLVMIVALSLLALKPQVGLVMAGLLVPSLFWWRALLGAAVVVMAMALPSFLQDGFVAVLGDILTRLGEYDDFGVNGPLELSGVGNLAYVVFGLTIPTTTSLALGILATCAIGVWVQKAPLHIPPANVLMFTIVITACFVPLHLYDLIFLAALLMLPAALSPFVQGGIALGVFIVWRANNLESAIGLTPPETLYGSGVFISSAVLVWLGAALVYAAVSDQKDHAKRSA